MSGKNFLEVSLPEDTQPAVSPRRRSSAEFIAHCEQMKLEYWENFLGLPVPEDTQSTSDLPPISQDEFTAQCEFQNSEYQKSQYSGKSLVDWVPDEDTQPVSDQEAMTLEEFTAQCDRQKADYWKSMEGKPAPGPRKKVPPMATFQHKLCDVI